MSEVPLRRRIPPKSVGELTMELMGDTAVSHHDAQAIAIAFHDQAMEEIYRLARIGEAFERLPAYSAEAPDKYCYGFADGWAGAQQWVRDHLEE